MTDQEPLGASASRLAQLAPWYFALQSSLGLAWWIGIESSPMFAKQFFSIDTALHDLTTFALADLTWFVVMSGFAAIAIWKNMRVAYPVAWCLVGAVGYAFFCCIGMMFDGGSWLSVLLMSGSWLGTLFFAIAISPIR